MRCLSRIGLAVLGLSVAAPPASQAGAPFMNGSYTPPSKPAKPATANQARPGGDAPADEEMLCPECQRAKLMAQGIRVPPVPPPPDGMIVGSRACPKCNRPAAYTVMGPARPSKPAAGATMMAGGDAPGRAVVGGEMMPGYAVVEGEPAPVGVMRTTFAGPGAGRPMPSDRAAMGSMGPIPAAPTPTGAVGDTRPHILGHLFGISALRRDLRESREAREERKRELHAATTYGPQDQATVTELPASMVYGRR
jgi:hypothetical protein